MSTLFQKIFGFLEWLEESGGKHIVFLIINIIIVHYNTYTMCT